jgi:hypothetical protein
MTARNRLSQTRIVPILLALICLARVGHADIIAMATETFNQPPADFQLTDTYDQDFTLTVLGGTGSGYFIPLFSVQGEDTQTSPGIETAVANVTSPTNLGIDWTFGPSASCAPGTCAWMPFTFGVPQDFRIIASASVAWSSFFDGEPFVPTTLTADVSFDGLGYFTQSRGSNDYMNHVTYALVPVDSAPEPQCLALMLAGLAILALYLSYHTRSMRQVLA